MIHECGGIFNIKFRHLHVWPHQPLPGVLLEQALQERPEKERRKRDSITFSKVSEADPEIRFSLTLRPLTHFLLDMGDCACLSGGMYI